MPYIQVKRYIGVVSCEYKVCCVDTDIIADRQDCNLCLNCVRTRKNSCRCTDIIIDGKFCSFYLVRILVIIGSSMT